MKGRRFAVVTPTRYIAHPADRSGKSLGWTYDIEHAKGIAFAVGGHVYDADEFARNPDPTAHEPVWRNPEIGVSA